MLKVTMSVDKEKETMLYETEASLLLSRLASAERLAVVRIASLLQTEILEFLTLSFSDFYFLI